MVYFGKAPSGEVFVRGVGIGGGTVDVLAGGGGGGGMIVFEIFFVVVGLRRCVFFRCF